MYKIYEIVNQKSQRRYIGMTQNALNVRFNSHKCAARQGKKSPLYDAIRSYGFENFTINLLHEFETKQECCDKEIELISSTSNLYNLASGGEGGFTVTNILEWKQKLKLARQGRQPFLNQNHSEETKKRCGEASSKYWASKRAENNELS